jgi:Spy/CpxP family protein refolding chaperone
MLAVALDLTQAQQDQATSILGAHKADFRQLAERGRAAQDTVRQAVEATEFNEQAIRAAVAARGLVEADAAVLRAKVQQELTALLTPEQKTKADQLRAAMAHGPRGFMPPGPPPSPDGR